MMDNKKGGSHLISKACGNHEEEEPIIINKRSSTSSLSTTMVIVPHDLINKILTRVPLEHLICRCQLVCEDWRRLIIYDSDFKLMRSQRTPTISGYLFQLTSPTTFSREKSYKFISFTNHVHENQIPPIPSPSHPIDFLPEGKEVDILSPSSPHGLFLCSVYTASGFNYYVCKPTTREWQKIPNPNNCEGDSYTLKIVIQRRASGSPLHYKIIRLGCLHRKICISDVYYLVFDCQIFDSDNWEWSNINDESILLPECFHSTNARVYPHGILVHGAVHWLSYYEFEICALDVNNFGRWKSVALPKDEQLCDEMKEYDAHVKRLVECEGELGLLYLGYPKRLILELWVLKDYYYDDNVDDCGEAIIWNKIYLVDLGPGYGEVRRHSFELKCCREILHLYTKDIILIQIEDEIIWYNHKTGIRTVAFKVPAGGSIQGPGLQIHSDFIPFL